MEGNRALEGTLHAGGVHLLKAVKPKPGASPEEKADFIQRKYIDLEFVPKDTPIAVSGVIV